MYELLGPKQHIHNILQRMTASVVSAPWDMACLQQIAAHNHCLGICYRFGQPLPQALFIFISQAPELARARQTTSSVLPMATVCPSPGAVMGTQTALMAVMRRSVVSDHPWRGISEWKFGLVSVRGVGLWLWL